jgi:hypothetical protein
MHCEVLGQEERDKEKEYMSEASPKEKAVRVLGDTFEHERWPVQNND